MPLKTPVDREFQIRPRGYVRDKVVLANFAEGLRTRRNPATGAVFTEDEIRRAIRAKSRWYIGAQAIDDYDQGEQRKALYMNDQVRIERASSAWLRDFHGRLEGETYLPASGASGTVLVRGTPGILVRGSTTPNDPDAYTARSTTATLYQVYTPVIIGDDGTAEVTMFALSTGKGTNLVMPAQLQWARRDPNMAAQTTLATDFQGGTDRETDAEFASRLASIKRFRPAAGNDANFRAWARAASNSIEEGWVYPNALYSGTTLIALTEKRSGALGPLGRIPTGFVLAQGVSHLTTPSSAVVPGIARTLVTSVNAEPTDGLVLLGLQRGTASGWTDALPFPKQDATTKARISALTSQTNFVIECVNNTTLPGQVALATLVGDATPAIMIWDRVRSSFERLSIASIEDLGGHFFHVLLTAPTTATLATDDWISPHVDRHALISKAVVDYFDSLGPGEVVDQDADIRAGRCVRFPFTDEWPMRAGSLVVSRITESLGNADGKLENFSLETPSLPVLMRNGPNMLVPGKFAVGEL